MTNTVKSPCKAKDPANERAIGRASSRYEPSIALADLAGQPPITEREITLLREYLAEEIDRILRDTA
ncbi:hypothetical protein AAFN86_00885 [Roseomonas sp. CAU 1739]